MRHGISFKLRDMLAQMDQSLVNNLTSTSCVIEGGRHESLKAFQEDSDLGTEI